MQNKAIEEKGVRVQIIADSVAKSGDRVTSFEVRTHRFTLAEWNTHCLFSRNSASSRAIPFTKQLERFTEDPALPVVWASEKPGMSGGEELEDEDLMDAVELWYAFQKDVAILLNDYLQAHPEPEHRLHKSLLNRLMEPLQWHTMLITSANYENFFNLRVSPNAMPEICLAAELMQSLYEVSSPVLLLNGEWHLPYVRENEQIVGSRLWSPTDDTGRRAGYDGREISSSRAAATSYETQWADKGYVKEIERYMGLTQNGHWSPLEHICTPWAFNIDVVPIPDPDTNEKLDERRVAKLGKFPGWLQWRHVVEGRQKVNTYR